MLEVGDVVQFNERHKWCGSLGIVTEVKDYAEEPPMIRYMVGVPCPQQGTAYIFVMASEMAIEYVGKAIFMAKDDIEEK